jgi:hypothetical protein
MNDHIWDWLYMIIYEKMSSKSLFFGRVLSLAMVLAWSLWPIEQCQCSAAWSSLALRSSSYSQIMRYFPSISTEPTGLECEKKCEIKCLKWTYESCWICSSACSETPDVSICTRGACRKIGKVMEMLFRSLYFRIFLGYFSFFFASFLFGNLVD